MQLDEALNLHDKLIADADRRQAAQSHDAHRGVMTWDCAICFAPNAFWRNHCVLCDAPQHGFAETTPTFGIGWPD